MCLREKIGPDPRNFNQRVSLGRNDLLIRTFPNLMNRKAYNNINIFIIALALCLVAVPFSRYISPHAIVNGHDVYLAWLPLSVMLAVILLFGRRAIIPVLLSFIVTNVYIFI
jgi:uncharacterized membrane protein YidH (DUF202 family)